MSVSRNIVATYRGPGRVVRALYALVPQEGRLLAYAMGACGLIFVSQTPVLARRAHLEDTELNMLLGGSLMAWIFVAPLLLYALAALAYGVARVLGGQGTQYGARLSLFWALLASSPIILLHGLLAGFVGPGPGLQGVGLIWLLCFLWFWMSGMRAVNTSEAHA